MEREDILKFMTDCYKGGLGNRTVYDKLVVVLQFFKRNGKIKLIVSSDWPQYVEKIRAIYEPEEIGALLCHALHGEAIFIKFMVASGFRDREERFLIWRDCSGTARSVIRRRTRQRLRPRAGRLPKQGQIQPRPL